MAIFDVTEAFTDLLVTRTISSKPIGMYVKGQWETPPPLTRDIETVIQTSSKAERQLILPEGKFNTDMVTLWTEEELQVADKELQNEGDVVHHNGKQYRVTDKEDWSYEGGFMKYYAIKE